MSGVLVIATGVASFLFGWELHSWIVWASHLFH
jgi:hypothetical protein